MKWLNHEIHAFRFQPAVIRLDSDTSLVTFKQRVGRETLYPMIQQKPEHAVDPVQV